jgi:hypothetical protein
MEINIDSFTTSLKQQLADEFKAVAVRVFRIEADDIIKRMISNDLRRRYENIVSEMLSSLANEATIKTASGDMTLKEYIVSWLNASKNSTTRGCLNYRQSLEQMLHTVLERSAERIIRERLENEVNKEEFRAELQKKIVDQLAKKLVQL